MVANFTYLQFNCQKHFHFKLFKQLYVVIQLSVNTVLMSKNSSISNNSVKHKHAFKCKYGLIVKNISISSYSVYSIQFSISMLLFLFNPWIGPYQVLPLRARVDLGTMAMKGYSAFSKVPALLEAHHQIV